jgi:Ser/Thr protein kinase RdoA (MazF antagonist)
MPADWPALRPDETRAVLARYPDVAHDVELLWHSPRPLSAAALVEAGGARWFLKRHALEVRNAATLGEEHRFMRHLQRHGYSVPMVLHNRDGGTATVHEGWVYEVHTPLQGIDLYRELVSWSPLCSLAHARSAGAALARLHEAAQGYAAAQRDTHLLVTRDDLVRAADPIHALRAQFPQRPGLAQYLGRRNWERDFERILLPPQQRIQARIAEAPRLWTHNDWHASNLAWSSEGDKATVRSAFDFGLASPTFALFDLATAIERNAVAWLELERGAAAVHADTAVALLGGYAEVRPLSAADLDLVAGLLPVLHIDFALSEVEYFHAVTGTPAHADLAYDSFLLGHAKWFDTAPARHLLDAIRNAK